MTTAHHKHDTATGGSNPWFTVSMVLIGVIGGYTLAMTTGQGGALPLFGGNGGTVVNAPSAPTAPTAPTAAPVAKDVVPISSDDHVRGDANAEISVIEYSDFECPFCSRHHPTMVQLLDKYDGKVNWVYRHFPLSFHPNAMPAAIASECVASLGGKDDFWKFADEIFANQGNWDFVTIAKNMGIDEGDFTDCTKSGKFDQKIKDQMNTGANSGINGTPGTIVYNNKTKEAKLVSGAQPLASFDAAIEELSK